MDFVDGINAIISPIFQIFDHLIARKRSRMLTQPAVIR